jgi:hypothetical protein
VRNYTILLQIYDALLFSLFSELKIGVHLKFKALFFTLQKSQKHHFPQKTSDLAKRVVHFMDSKKCICL